MRISIDSGDIPDKGIWLRVSLDVLLTKQAIDQVIYEIGEKPENEDWADDSDLFWFLRGIFLCSDFDTRHKSIEFDGMDIALCRSKLKLDDWR